MSLAGAAGGAGAGLELVDEIDAQGAEGGQNSRDQARGQGKNQRERKCASAEGDVGPPGDIAGDTLGHGDEAEVEAKAGEQDAAGRAE